MSRAKLLEVENVSKYYRHKESQITALKSVDFHIECSEILGVVGESGSGKSTVAKLITKLEMPKEGSILFNGTNLKDYSGKKSVEFYKDVQMVFQDAKASFNKRMTIGSSIQEHYKNLMGKDQFLNLEALLALVGLKDYHGQRYPHELSGGECQRAAIARAVSTEPKLLICDEATSALDVTTQAQIIELLHQLKLRLNMSILMISHDLALVSTMCNRICVFLNGEIVEMGSTYDVIHYPKEKYTKKLLDSIIVI